MKLPQTRTVAILAEQGFDDEDLSRVLKEFKKAGIIPDIVSSALGVIEGAGGTEIEVGNTLQTVDSVLYDAVYIPGGRTVERLKLHKAASDFVNEAFGHYKAVGAAGEGVDLLLSAAGATRLHSRALSPLVVIRTKTTSAKSWSKRSAGTAIGIGKFNNKAGRLDACPF